MLRYYPSALTRCVPLCSVTTPSSDPLCSVVLPRYSLSLAREPETRHRARYQTEGSRGAVKDATGKTSPQVVVSTSAPSPAPSVACLPRGLELLRSFSVL